MKTALLFVFATMMHFATILPDWNSLESVRRAHTNLEGAALVFFALLVVAEALAHLTENKPRERLFDKVGICFFAIAVLAEIAAFPYGQRNDTLSEQTIGSLDAKVKEANGNADKAGTNSSTALSQAKDALTKAGKAEDSLGKAESEANGAQTASSQALNLARGARTEADSFEKDIVSAKKQAADAESHLAEALQKATDATRALREEEAKREAIEKRLAPRLFGPDRVAALIKLLKQFTPQRVDVMTYPHDTEAEMLAIPFTGAFINSGWKVTRFEPMDSEGITGILVEVDRSDSTSIKVAQSLADGIRSPDLTVTGPVPTLPRKYLVGYTGPGPGINPDAPIRITIGSK